MTGLAPEGVEAIAEKQSALSAKIEEKAWRSIVSSLPENDRIRLVSESGHFAADWLTAIPSEELGYAIPPTHYRMLVRWWLGQTVYPSEGPCPVCGKTNDAYGYHALTCKKGGETIWRHHSLANECARALQAAHHQPAREKAIGGQGQRPGDVYVPHWKLGRPLAMDFAVTHPQQPNNKTLAREVVPAGSWAQRYAEQHKWMQQELCAQADVDFQPMVVECFGAWDPAALTVLHEIAEQYAMHQHVPKSAAVRILGQRLSFTLARMNLRILLARGDGFSDPEDGILSLDDADDAQDAVIDAVARV
ncbi:MAG: hypothetical protein GY700_03710 [Propionibacteriaceae bacterium]|nr:hypothetical protein [Propionibacteriaceae bacterium]